MPQESEITVDVKAEYGICDDWADSYAFIGDGQYARVYCVRRETMTDVVVVAYDCDFGTCRSDGVDLGTCHRDKLYGEKVFEVGEAERTDWWVEEYAENHRDAIKNTRDRFGDE